MSVYTITYYLKEEDTSCDCEDHDHDHRRDDYELTSHIKTLGAWAHFMPTSFLVKSEFSSEEILDKLKDSVEDGDMIFISKVDKNDVASLTPNVISWINK